MKEKENQKAAVCPICGCELQAQGEALFKEHHERLWRKKCKELGIQPYGSYDKCFGKLFYCSTGYGMFGSSEGVPEDKPAELIKWEAENPIPEIDFLDFVVDLAKRVFAIKSKKGGSR